MSEIIAETIAGIIALTSVAFVLASIVYFIDRDIFYDKDIPGANEYVDFVDRMIVKFMKNVQVRIKKENGNEEDHTLKVEKGFIKKERKRQG